MTLELDELISRRRGKLLPVSHETVLDCVIDQNQKITEINRVSLPKDMYVHDVFYNSSARCFMFLIFSKEFDRIPFGQEFPVIWDLETRLISLEVAK